MEMLLMESKDSQIIPQARRYNRSMVKLALILVAACTFLRAEIHSLSLRQAVERALQQNPDITLARLEEESARYAVRIARDPFTPKVTVGSGLAYSNGFPMSIEGSAPSIVQARATQFLFNRQQSFAVAQAKESARGASYELGSKRDEVAYRTAGFYADAERAARVLALAGKDAESLQAVLETIQAQVKEGRALPLAEKQAALQVARERQLATDLENEQIGAETLLAIAAGYSAEDRVRPIAQDRTAPALPASEEQAIQAALDSNKDLQKLQSQIAAKGLEIRGEKAARLPRVDLVAQYGLFAKFNNYTAYFNAFKRNNGQIGVSFQVPVFMGSGASAQLAQTQTEVSHLRVQLANARNRISADLHQSFRDVKKAEIGAEVARLDLEVAREQLSVNLAQMQEGRLALRLVEEAHVAENTKWIAFFDAQYAAEKSRWNVLRLMGELVPAIQGMP
jgi:outer membrane protein